MIFGDDYAKQGKETVKTPDAAKGFTDVKPAKRPLLVKPPEE